MSARTLAQEVRQQLEALGGLFRQSRRERLSGARIGDGKEHPDPTPVEMPLDYDRPYSMQELVQRYIRQELSAQANAVGLGTFEEENDFTPEDPEEIVLTGYEVHEYDFIEDPVSPLVGDPDAQGDEGGSTGTGSVEISPPRGSEAHHLGARAPKGRPSSETEPAPGSEGDL